MREKERKTQKPHQTYKTETKEKQEEDEESLPFGSIRMCIDGFHTALHLWPVHQLAYVYSFSNREKNFDTFLKKNVQKKKLEKKHTIFKKM